MSATSPRMMGGHMVAARRVRWPGGSWARPCWPSSCEAALLPALSRPTAG